MSRIPVIKLLQVVSGSNAGVALGILKFSVSQVSVGGGECMLHV